MNDEHEPSSAGKVLQLFEQGKQFTEELLQENEKLRRIITGLRAEKQDLEGQYVKVDGPRMREKIELLESELRLLREENEDLKGQFVSVEDENREFADRYVEVERQNSDLVHLYVASPNPTISQAASARACSMASTASRVASLSTRRRTGDPPGRTRRAALLSHSKRSVLTLRSR